MIRTIQHPGVQIQESEIGSYRSTVVMNNAYIMGFADRGPVYDYSWITTTKEFTKIYGEPQTEAEKYLFIAVQSVLQNGGTPIVARMPYDNKQCKAYKAMKITWADITPDINTRLDSPVVPLEDVEARIKRDKSFAELFTPNSITVSGNAVTEDWIRENLTVDQMIMQLSPYEAGSSASKGSLYEGLIKELKINGVYPSSLNVDQIAVSSMLASVRNDQVKGVRKYYRYDEGLNNLDPNTADYTSLADALSSGFTTESDEYYRVNGKYLRYTWLVQEEDEDGLTVSSYKSILINLFGTSPDNDYVDGLPCYNCGSIPETVAKHLSGNIMETPLSGETFERISDKEYYTDWKFAPSDDSMTAIMSIPESGYCDEAYTAGAAPSASFIIEKVEGPTVAYVTYDFDGDDFVVQPTIVENGKVYKGYTSKHASAIAAYISDLSGEIIEDEGVISSRFGECSNSVGGLVVNGILNGTTTKSTTEPIDTLLPLFTNTQNGKIIGLNDSANGMSVAQYVNSDLYTGGPNDIQLVGFYNYDLESPAVSGTIKVSDIDWSKLFVKNRLSKVKVFGTDSTLGDLLEDAPETELKVYAKTCVSSEGKIVDLETAAYHGEGEKLYDIIDFSIDRGKYEFTSVNWNDQSTSDRDVIAHGNVFVEDFAAVAVYTSTMLGMGMIDIDNDDLIQNESLVWLNTIYNNPYFLELDNATYTALEASLLTTPEMGFKYGLYLDSDDCEISNSQYDDLVTVNQFKAVDRTVDKYGQDIDDANFLIVDKQKTVVQGVGGNIGYFTVLVDPFDALKVQRLLVNPAEKEAASRTVDGRDENDDPVTRTYQFDHSTGNINRLDYWAYESADAWNKIYDDLLDSMDCLQRVRNADGVYIGEPNPIDGKLNILDSWSIPLTGGYYDESISKILMKKFPGISMAGLDADELMNKETPPSIIDHSFATHVMVAVCKTTIDPSNGKIVVNLVETFFGSLFNEKNAQNGRSLFIGDIINENSDFIEFYRNDYVSAGDQGAYDPPEYRRTEVNQIFLKDSDELKNAAQMRGIDYEDYGCDALDPAVKEAHEAEYYKDLEKYHIYAVNKKEVCLYNIHWEANLTSFSKKESQKIIANTTGLYATSDGTTINIAKNFLIDMDRCIKFIKNIDDIPLHFICDAGLSTIAQFCDNVVWNPRKKAVVGEETDPVTHKKTGVKLYETVGGWITQPFDPDNDPDGDDRYITSYEDVSTWRKVVEKITEIAGEIRKDCFAIIDAPRQLTLDGAAPKIRRSKITNNFDKTIGRALRYVSGLNSSYVAGYYNWLRTTDQYSGTSIWIPPTTKIIGNYCYLNINNLPWLAPAGLTYGLINGCHAISHNPDSQEEDQIYLKSWNYIKQYPFDGLVIEGQRTMLGKESVFERVNVRLLFLDLERFAYQVSRTFKYQVNNAYTREQFVQTLKPKFEDYTLRGGIYEYMIKVDDTNNTPETIDALELHGDIFIKPAKLIEYVLLNFIGTTTATNFQELLIG